MTEDTDPAIDQGVDQSAEKKLRALFDKMGHHGMEDRLLSTMLEAETPDDVSFHERLRQTKIENASLTKDKEAAKKADDRFTKLDRFDTPAGPVTIGHIAPAKETLQSPAQKEFFTGSRVQLLLDNNSTIVETRSMEETKLEVHARQYRLTDGNREDLAGLALRDALTIPPLVDKHLGGLVVTAVGDADGHILLTLGAGEARVVEVVTLPPESATPMTGALFERMNPYEQKLFAEALSTDCVFDTRVGNGVVRKTGGPGTTEITHIDPESLTQLKEYEGTAYSIVLARALPSDLIIQLAGMPVRDLAEMEPWMMDIYGDKTIKLVLNTGGNCTITLN